MMKYNPEIHHRRSIRLRDHDYALEGAYFVTVCVQGREDLFGEIRHGVMIPNEAGRMVVEWWRNVPGKFGNTRLDEFVIMPNHFHVIIMLVGADPCVRPNFVGANANEGGHTGPEIHRIIQWFKTMTTNAYIRGVNEHGWPPFSGRLWQRNYFERVIRDAAELARAREYVRGNPGRWGEDPENSARS